MIRQNIRKILLDQIKPGKILVWVKLCHQTLKLEPFTQPFFLN